MMSAPKDTQIAMNVQQMAAYGYFKEEFLYYGYAFKRGEQIVYRLSEDRASLYAIITRVFLKTLCRRRCMSF